MDKKVMRTEKEFSKITGAFLAAVLGKMGNEFIEAAIKFMENRGFQTPTIIRKYEDEKGRVTVYTDSPLNSNGIVHVEFFKAVNGSYGVVLAMNGEDINVLLEVIDSTENWVWKIRGII